MRQAQFLSALLNQIPDMQNGMDMDPTKAALAIGVSQEQAREWGRMMLKSVPVRQALHAQIRAQIEITQITPVRWLQEVARIALTEPDLREYYNEDGTLKPIREWTEEMAAHVQEIETDEIWRGRGDDREHAGLTRKLKLRPKSIKLTALELVAKYYKLIQDELHVLVTGAGKDGTIKTENVNITAELTALTAEEATRIYMGRLKEGY